MTLENVICLTVQWENITYVSPFSSATREADHRRYAVQASAQAIMANAIDGPPSFNDLDVIWEHTY